MNNPITLADVLHWRLAEAEASAPPPPRATRLLDLARPWWETYPEKYKAFADRFSSFRIRYGHALVDPAAAALAHPVPVLIVQSDGERETSAQLLYLTTSESTIRLRFELAESNLGEGAFESTFIDQKTLQPLFTAEVRGSIGNEYGLESPLPDYLGLKWMSLKVTDQMPFLLILRPKKTKL